LSEGFLSSLVIAYLTLEALLTLETLTKVSAILLVSYDISTLTLPLLGSTITVLVIPAILESLSSTKYFIT